MEADRIAPALEHGRLQVVVQKYPRYPVERLERADVTGEEAVGPGIEVEAKEDRAAEGEHHHEGHQRAARPPDAHVTEVRPVDLGLLAGERAKPQVRFGLALGSKLRDARPEVARPAPIAARRDHAVQTRSRQPRVLLERLEDERDPAIDLGGAMRALDLGQPRLAEHAIDRRVMDAQLGCNHVHAPAIDEGAAQDLGLEVRGDGHRYPLCNKRSARTPRRPRSNGRRKPRRRNGTHSRRQRVQ